MQEAFQEAEVGRLSRRAALVGLAGTMLAGCSAVSAFNAVMPKDAGAGRIAEGIAYGSDPRQKLDLYAPPQAQGLPAVLFLYGGSWNSGSRADYAFVGDALAAQGFLVAVADYRLVPEVRYPVFLDDNAMALKWLRDHAAAYGGNPKSLFVMGHSAGAYDAVMLALDPSLSGRAGLRGQVLSGAIGLSGPYDFLPLDVPETKEAFGAWPRLAETQPINHVSRFAPPMLLATGTEDTTVYPRNTRRLAALLKAAGVPVEEREYAGIGHAGMITAFARPFRDRAPALADAARFIKAHAR